MITAEERLRLALETAGLGALEQDLLTGELDCDARALELLGLARENAPSWASLEAAIHPLDRDALRAALSTAHGTQGPSSFTVDCRLHEAPDGTERWVQLQGRVLFAQGAPVRLIATAREVTRAKEAERAQALLAAIVQSSRDAIVSKTLDGRVTSWNRGAERLFGYRAEEMIGQPIARIIPPEYLAEEELILQRIRQGMNLEHYQAERLTKQGERIFTSISVSPVRDTAGRIVGASKIAQDVGEQRRASDELARSELALRTLTESVPALVFVCDALGNKVYANQVFLDYVGLARESILREGWREIVHPDDLGEANERWARALASGEPYRGEFRFRRADGQYRWVLTSALPIRDAGGAISRWFGAGMETHETKEAEAALRESDRHKDEFLAVLAHELRNPLAPLRNALQILKLTQDRPARVAAMREMMERQVAQMVRLIDDLLDVSRVTRGKLELRRTRTTLAAVLEAAVETARPMIDAAGHDLRLLLPEVPVEIDGDPTRLAQVFANLLTNSAKFMDAGGEIRLVATASPGEICVSVTDTGYGLDASELPQVFKMFAQVRRANTVSKGGLGLGLALVRQLVELHGGSVSAESEGRGLGCRFTVRLPAQSLAVAAAPATVMLAADVPPSALARPSAPGPGHLAPRRRVLVVDDNADSVATLSRLLELHGHDVRCAQDGIEAIAVADYFRPQVIFMDIAMPRMDGLEASRAIRAAPWGNEVLICALTGFGQAGDRERTREAGIDHHLVKPVDVRAMVELLSATACAG